MKSLYRKYRPLTLDMVVGQEQVVEPLKNALENGRVSHAYLFTGPRGTGKTSVARIFAHAVNDFKYELEDEYVDIIEIDGASNRGIDNIREIREKAVIKPTLGKYKVYIIDEVHMLTKEAFNALLKTLEEPPEHVIFMMATTDAHKVPITITSRAQTYNFKLVNFETVLEHLEIIADKEEIPIETDALKIVVKRGGGSFRDSLSLLDQISTLSDKEITKEMVEKAMGLPEDEKITDLIKAYAAGDVVKITTLLKELYNTGVKAEIIAGEMIEGIIEDPTAETLPILEKLPEVRAPFAEAKLLCFLASSNATNRSSALKENTANEAPPKEKSIKDDSTTKTPPHKTFSREKVPEVAPDNDNNNEDNNSINNNGDNGIFDWDNFLDSVKAKNDAIFAQLKDARWRIINDQLLIEPAKSFAKVILNKPNNLKILNEVAGKIVKVGTSEDLKNLETSVDSVNNTNNKNSETKNISSNTVSSVENAKNDDLKAKISAIMGGEVEYYGGGSPF